MAVEDDAEVAYEAGLQDGVEDAPVEASLLAQSAVARPFGLGKRGGQRAVVHVGSSRGAFGYVCSTALTRAVGAVGAVGDRSTPRPLRSLRRLLISQPQHHDSPEIVDTVFGFHEIHHPACGVATVVRTVSDAVEAQVEAGDGQGLVGDGDVRVGEAGTVSRSRTRLRRAGS